MNALAAVARPLTALGQSVYGGLDRLRTGAIRFTAGWGWTVLLNRTAIDYATIDPTRNSMVVSVVGWIARNFPEAPVRVTVRGAGGLREAVAPGPTGAGRMLQLLERPNRFFSGVVMWMAVLVDLYTTGNAYILKLRNAADRVVELWWIPKRFMRPNWPTDGSEFIGWYEYTVDGYVYAVEPRDVIHLRDGIDPQNTRLGLSKLASLFREIYTDDEASNFTAALLTNLGVPGVILAPSNTQGAVKADPEAVKKKFSETFGGDNRGGVMALSSPTDVKVLSWSPEQMNLANLRRIPEERVSAVLGISAAVVGLGAGLNTQAFTSYRDARMAAYEEAVIPMQRMVAGELEVQFLPDFVDEFEIERTGMDIDFDISHVRALQDTVEAVWKRNESAATKGLLTRATFKRATGQQVEPGDDVYVLPNNYVTLPVGAGGPTSPGARTPGLLGDTALPRVTTPERPLLTAGAGPVRCQGTKTMPDGAAERCDRVLAELAAAPYRFTCPRCKTVTEKTLDPVAA